MRSVIATAERRAARGDEVSPATYWFWSEIPTREQAERQTSEIARAGFSTVMIQPRLSFARELYLSPEYLCGYRIAVEAAAAAGLQVGIYDEYNWASGHAGGRTVAGNDHLRERHLFWSRSQLGEDLHRATVSDIHSDWFDDLGRPGRAWIYEGESRRWDEWELVAAIAHPPREIELSATVDVTGWTDCTGDSEGCNVETAAAASVPSGWVVTSFVSARCATSRLINYLDPRAAERFITVAYEPYAEALDGLLGDPVRSFSFDHPYGGFYDWHERQGSVGNSLMWHHDLPLARSCGTRELGRLLLATAHDAGSDSRAARCAFFSAYSAHGIESFFGTLARWTAERGIGLTGHELLAHVGGWGLDDAFPFIDARTNFGLDYFAVDRHRTQTLVDSSNFGPQISARFGDSVARAHGRDRCIVEQYAARNELPGHYAAGYWELALDELRLQALRIHLLGGRQFLFHAFNQSDGTGADHEVLANPRFDFPPACNFEPWFEHFALLARESAAVSGFIDGAEPIRDVALVYPLHTVWAEGPGHVHGRLVGGWARLLATEGIGFDLVDDRDLAGAEVCGGRLHLGSHGYRTVILAGATTLPSERCVDVLERLVAGGGAVVATAPLATATAARGEDATLGARIAALCNGPVRDAVPGELPAAVAPGVDDVVVDAGDGRGTLWRWVGRDDRGFRLVLLNDGPDRRRATVSLACLARARRLRADGLRDWPWSSHDGGRTHVAVDLEPEDAVCLCLEAAEDLSPGLVDATGFVSDLTLAGDEIRVLADIEAQLVVRGRDEERAVHHAGEHLPAYVIALTDGWTFSAGGAPPVPIDPSRGWEQQGFASFAGAGTYRHRFDAVPGERRWAIVVPIVNCAVQARLNGAPLGVRAWRPFRFEIEPPLLRASDNELELTVTNSAANRYYAGTPFQAGLQPSGLGAVPLLVSDRCERRVSIAAGAHAVEAT